MGRNKMDSHWLEFREGGRYSNDNQKRNFNLSYTVDAMEVYTQGSEEVVQLRPGGWLGVSQVEFRRESATPESSRAEAV